MIEKTDAIIRPAANIEVDSACALDYILYDMENASSGRALRMSSGAVVPYVKQGDDFVMSLRIDALYK